MAENHRIYIVYMYGYLLDSSKVVMSIVKPLEVYDL